MNLKNLKKTITLGISSILMTGVLTLSTDFAEVIPGQQYTTFTNASEPIVDQIKEGNAQITIKDNGHNSNAQYTAYKILNAEISDTVYKYTVNDDFSSLFGATGSYTVDVGGSLKKKGSSDTITANSDEAKEFAQAVEALVNSNNVIGTAFNVGQSVEFSPGYYVIIQTGVTTGSSDAWVPSIPILVDLPQKINDKYAYNITVEPKGGYPNITKGIVENGNINNNNDVSIGQNIEYKIESDVTKYSSNAANITYKITDILSKGLTYNKNATVKALKGTTETELTNASYVVTETPIDESKGGGTEIIFNFVYDKIKDFDKIVINYSATLNNNAIIGTGGNSNGVTLEYTNVPGSTTTAIAPDNLTYTYGIAIKKVDQNTTNTALVGAKFGIYTDPSCTTPYTSGNLEEETNTNGYQKFTGLDTGTYYIKEIQAPTGYVRFDKVLQIKIGGLDESDQVTTDNNKLTGNAKYTISIEGETGNVVSFIVKNGNAESINGASLTNEYIFDGLGLSVVGNIKGAQLPVTGGIGTWMFTIGGLALMVVAVIAIFIAKKKEGK